MKSALAIVALLAGCATTPTPIAEAAPVPSDRHLAFKEPSQSAARIVVRRDSGIMASACAARLFINGAPAAYVRIGEIVTFYVPAGEIILGADPGAICAGGLVEARIDIKPGQIAHYRVGYDAGGSIALYPTATR